MTPAEQARAFAAMLLCGVCLGAAYDLLGTLRRVRGLCAVTDVLFGVLGAAGIIWTALRLECEAFRLYAFAGAAGGMTLYGATVGAAVRRISAAARRSTVRRKEKRKKHALPAGN